MKKILSFLMITVLSLTTLQVFAADTRTSGLYTYEIKGNGTITITDFDWTHNGSDIYIPNMIDGYTVTGIGNNAFSVEKTKYANTPYSVTLPEGIKSIGDMAFANANISAINIPSSVQYIGAAAFWGCPSCQFKIVANQKYFAVIEDGLYNKSAKELISYSWKNTEAKEEAFRGKVVTINIPEGILSIGAYALADIDTDSYYNTDLDIYLPSTLASIGDYAFANAEWVDGLYGKLSKVKKIGNSAFENCCIHDCSLTLNGVESIGNRAFNNTYIYKNIMSTGYSINFTGAPIQSIGNAAFDRIGDPSASHDSNVFAISVQSCIQIGKNNPGLGSIIKTESDFPSAITTVPSGLNPQISSLPDSVTSIEARAFTQTVSDFRLSASLKEIDVNAFPKGSTFIVDAGSYADLWCSENGFGYTIEGQEDDLSWLTEGLSSEPDNQYSELLEIAKETMAEYIGEPYVLIDTSSVDAFCQSFALIEGFGALNVNSVNDCLAIGDPNPEWAYYICEMIFAGEMF